LLGLTATPERHDELDILGYFDNHIAAEIRLPDAINRKLLSPFQYFGITDCVDFSTLRWQRGGYLIEDLEKVLTGNDLRAVLIIEKIRALLLDVRQARGLGFCVSIQHAEYMAKVFNRAAIPSAPLSAQSPAELRRAIQKQLVAREINFIFVVDLYNEGVDIPELDTIILLRPTESLTVFLQQLGRGLRLHENKECLTLLDFIGQAHANYNFKARFRALSADPTLPSPSCLRAFRRRSSTTRNAQKRSIAKSGLLNSTPRFCENDSRTILRESLLQLRFATLR
jgi:superfamily II DNA or RNA helicase